MSRKELEWIYSDGGEDSGALVDSEGLKLHAVLIECGNFFISASVGEFLNSKIEGLAERAARGTNADLFEGHVGTVGDSGEVNIKLYREVRGNKRDARRLVRKTAEQEKVKEYLDRSRGYDYFETLRHSFRVAYLATILGYRNGLKEDLSILACAGLLHDIGKLQVPREVLDKKGKLNAEELRVIRSHVRKGLEMLGSFKPPKIREVIALHHEFKQEEPYPRLQGNRRKKVRGDSSDRRDYDKEIFNLGQIVAVADMYDALSSARSYKEALPREKVVKRLGEDFNGNQKYVKQILDLD